LEDSGPDNYFILGTNKRVSQMGKGDCPFQFLQLVVRDWPCFDDETWDDSSNRQQYNVPAVSGERWSVTHCRKQMEWHFKQHFGEEVKDRESVDTLNEMFNTISCYLLPSPGMKVCESRKRKWDGNLTDVDEDFTRFIDVFVKEEVFNEPVKVNQVLGGDLSPDSFVTVVETLVEAFSGMEVSALSMVDAISKAKNLVAKDESEKEYKKTMEKLMAKAKTGKKPEELDRDNSAAKCLCF